MRKCVRSIRSTGNVRAGVETRRRVRIVVIVMIAFIHLRNSGIESSVSDGVGRRGGRSVDRSMGSVSRMCVPLIRTDETLIHRCMDRWNDGIGRYTYRWNNAIDRYMDRSNDVIDRYMGRSNDAIDRYIYRSNDAIGRCMDRSNDAIDSIDHVEYTDGTDRSNQSIEPIQPINSIDQFHRSIRPNASIRPNESTHDDVRRRPRARARASPLARDGHGRTRRCRGRRFGQRRGRTPAVDVPVEFIRRHEMRVRGRGGGGENERRRGDDDEREEVSIERNARGARE